MEETKRALEAVQHIYLCEDEGMASGQPTKEDYLEARKLVAAALSELEGSKPKWDADAWFRKLIEGMELRTHPDRPHVNLWDGLINGERVTLFEQDLETGVVWCRWKYVWRVLEDKHSEEYTDVQAMMKRLLEKHLKWRVETTTPPSRPRWRRMKRLLEKHLKWRVETTDH